MSCTYIEPNEPVLKPGTLGLGHLEVRSNKGLIKNWIRQPMPLDQTYPDYVQLPDA
jgi:hypothetical protein